MNISISLIKQNPYQPRKIFNKEEIQNLSQNISKNGLLSPLVINLSENNYYLIAGERRLRACKLLNWTKVPVVIKEISMAKMRILALIENIERKDLNDLEIAFSLNKILIENNLTHEQLAKQIAKSRTYITNILSLLKLPNEVQKLILEGKLKQGHVRPLLKFLDNPEKLTIEALNILKNKFSVRDVENKIYEKKTFYKKSINENLINLENDIKNFLHRKVRLTSTKLVFTYKNKNDLNELLNKLNLNIGENNE